MVLEPWFTSSLPTLLFSLAWRKFHPGQVWSRKGLPLPPTTHLECVPSPAGSCRQDSSSPATLSCRTKLLVRAAGSPCCFSVCKTETLYQEERAKNVGTPTAHAAAPSCDGGSTRGEAEKTRAEPLLKAPSCGSEILSRRNTVYNIKELQSSPQRKWLYLKQTVGNSKGSLENN